MSPRQRTMATSSSHRSRGSASSTTSSAPSYPGSPPPAYYSRSPNPVFNSPNSPTWGYHSSSPRPTYQNYSGGSSSSSAAAPLLQTIPLPQVKDSIPPTLNQAQQHVSKRLMQPDRSLDFALPIPNLTHLGAATWPEMESLPVTFEFDKKVYNVRRSKGVRIHDVVLFISQYLQETISEKERARLNSLHSQRRIDLLGRYTRFGGLQCSSIPGDQCVWLVTFVP